MNGDLKTILQERCRSMEISLMGVANVERWDDRGRAMGIPRAFFPHSLFPEARSVIVIGLPIHLPVIETSPSLWYHEEYMIVNHLLDQYSYRLANFLNESGFPSIPVPRDGYAGIEALMKKPVAFFSHRHAAFLAGLGTFGVNNMILTPQYGPRARFASILTAATIPTDPLMEEEICIRCMRCVNLCPSHALKEGSYPVTLTDKMACIAHSARLNREGVSPCGICIKVCPAGEDRIRFQRVRPSLYESREGNEKYHRAWEHARSFGKR